MDPLIQKKNAVFDDMEQPGQKPVSFHKSHENPGASITSQIYNLPDMGNITKGVLCKLGSVSVVCLIFLCAEVSDFNKCQVVGGTIASSLAILSDAAHLFSDLSGFFISIFSIWLGMKPASERMSFGYHRAEVIGAMGSIILIWGLTIVLVYEATFRIIDKTVVSDPLIMLITAGFGLFCNLVMAKILHSGPAGDHHPLEPPSPKANKTAATFTSAKKQQEKQEDLGPVKSVNDDTDEVDSPASPNTKKQRGKNLSQMEESDNYNLRAAMIHVIVIGDIIQSLGVLLAALLIYLFAEHKDGVVVYNYWQLADPLCTYLFSILVLTTTFGVAKECIKVLMEAVPSELTITEFTQKLKAITHVQEVHDLHIWSLSVGKPAMSAHIVCTENPEFVLTRATKMCREFGIYHSTIQVEIAGRIGQKGYIKCLHNIHH